MIVCVCGVGCVCDAGMAGGFGKIGLGMASGFGKVVVCVSGRSSSVEVVAGMIGIGLEIEVDVVGGCEWVCELKERIGPK